MEGAVQKSDRKSDVLLYVLVVKEMVTAEKSGENNRLTLSVTSQQFFVHKIEATARWSERKRKGVLLYVSTYAVQCCSLARSIFQLWISPLILARWSMKSHLQQTKRKPLHTDVHVYDVCLGSFTENESETTLTTSPTNRFFCNFYFQCTGSRDET